MSHAYLERFSNVNKESSERERKKPIASNIRFPCGCVKKCGTN